MPLILPGNVASATAAGYEVANSCRFNAADSAFMNIAFGTNSQATSHKFTYSFWVKRASLGEQVLTSSYYSSSYYGIIRFIDTDEFEVYDYRTSGKVRKITNRLFRDLGAWYNIVVSSDNSVSSPELKIYVNGVQETSFRITDEYVQDETTSFNNDYNNYIGEEPSRYYFDGYMAEVCFIDSLALAPTSFGEFNSDSPTIWQPIDVSGLTFGTNGFYLDFEASDNLGNDANGGTDLTENNLAAIDSCTDSPTNNFATLNPLFGTAGKTFSEGNTHYSYDDNWQKAAISTIAVTAGKWYFEFRNEADHEMEAAVCNSTIANNGIYGLNTDNDNTYTLRTSNHAIAWRTGSSTGELVQNASNIRTDVGQVGEDDIGMFAFDCATGKIWTGKAGTWDNSGDPAGDSNPSTTWSTNFTAGEPTWFAFGSEADYALKVNFGNPSWTISSSQADDNGYGNFEYDVPTGFLALCTKNLGSDGG